MSGFGFSIGDIVLVGNYAYSVYKSCKNAGDNFREITSDVASLRTLLLALDDECKNPQSSFQQLSPAQKGELAARLQDCKADLRSVKKILHDFRSLDRRDARYRDRLAFTTGKQAAIREKIATHSVRLQQLLSGINVGTLSRIERNTDAHHLSLLEIRASLDRIHVDVLAGRRDAATFMNAEDAVALEDEVLDDRMTEVDVDVSYEVHAWAERVRTESLQPLSRSGNAIGSGEAGRTVRPSRNSRRISGVQDPSNTHHSGDDNRIRRNSRVSPGDGSVINEQSIRPEDRRESLEGRRAPEDGVTPRQNYAPRALQESLDSPSSTPTDSPRKSRYRRALLDLRDRPCSHSESYLFPGAWYTFDEQEKRWVKQTRSYTKWRPKRASSVLEYVDLTLEEVFTGTVKYFTLRRSTSTTDNETSFEDTKINLNIGKGAVDGAKFSYIVRTNPSETHKTDVVFEIRRKPHKLFQDVWANLAHRIHLSPTENKEGWKRKIRNIDGETISVYANGPLTTGQILALDGHGLPYSGRPSNRGVLILQIGYSSFDGAGRNISLDRISRSEDRPHFCAQLDKPNAEVVVSTEFPNKYHLTVIKALK